MLPRLDEDLQFRTTQTSAFPTNIDWTTTSSWFHQHCTEVLLKSFQLVHNVLEICSRCVTNVFQMLSKCVLNVDQLCTLQFAMKVIWCADRSPIICWIGQFRMKTHTMKSESKLENLQFAKFDDFISWALKTKITGSWKKKLWNFWLWVTALNYHIIKWKTGIRKRQLGKVTVPRSARTSCTTFSGPVRPFACPQEFFLLLSFSPFFSLSSFSPFHPLLSFPPTLHCSQIGQHVKFTLFNFQF